MNVFDINPFHELYVTDSPDPKTFVQLFSDFLVNHAAALFKPGNVVLRGTQGSGKSMLLNLLKPQIRLAYAQVGARFPVSDLFVGAGINLTRSGALDFGQRPLGRTAETDESLFPLYFADFLNYFIVRDILASVELIASNSSAFDSIVNSAQLDTFAKELAGQDCWFGYLASCNTFRAVSDRIDARIANYRSFHQFNSDLGKDIETTKTAIGEPIARTADCLKRTGALLDQVPVFIRIDQVERLYRSDVLRPSLGQQYRRIVNKALSLRDMRVSYRIGTRKYAWEDDLAMYGTDDRLEHIRDFRVIDLDDLLRRKEHVKTWIFPEFAQDVFRRRMTHSGFGSVDAADPIKQVFGSTPSPEDFAKQYAANASPARVLKLQEDVPQEWREYLESLFQQNPFSACLGAAWLHQQTHAKSKRKAEALHQTPESGSEPWNKQYWRKERTRQCLLQLAARTAQRLKWAGKEHILALSSGNISILISICHEIWNSYLRSQRRKRGSDQYSPVVRPIDPDVQSLGIQTAGTYWYHKVTEQPKGDDRQRFIDVLGRLFRLWLLDDVSMSYPGHNGFSLANDELDTALPLKRFLSDAADYGDLFESPHTTKEKDRRPRTKWYLTPILSVYFQIPETHVKEPKYVDLAHVSEWLSDAGVILAGFDLKVSSTSASGRQSRGSTKGKPEGLSLFPDEDSSDATDE